MNAIYTEDTLRALNKTQLIELFLKSQEHTKGIINSLTEEMKNLNENFKKLESDVAVVKNVNNILCKQIVSVERQCWKNAQYSRREFVEVVGLPRQLQMINLKIQFVEFCSTLVQILLMKRLSHVIGSIKMLTGQLLNF